MQVVFFEMNQFFGFGAAVTAAEGEIIQPIQLTRSVLTAAVVTTTAIGASARGVHRTAVVDETMTTMLVTA